jgi:hypothetical protein
MLNSLEECIRKLGMERKAWYTVAVEHADLRDAIILYAKAAAN